MNNNIKPLTRIGSILILIMFVIESILIIPLIWTIPGFIGISKISKGIATDADKIIVSILGILFGAFLGVLGAVLILIDLLTKPNPENRTYDYDNDYDQTNN